MATVDIPFGIGETCWKAEADWRTEYDPCPDCGGEKTVRVVLHDGTTLRVGCWPCLHHPGIMPRKVCAYVPIEYTPERVHRIEGDTCEYIPECGSGTIVRSTALRATREECEALCAELQQSKEAEDRARVLRNIAHNRDMDVSVAGQRIAEIRRLRRDLAALEAKHLEESP